MASREETETVIVWTLADEKATVSTLMPKIARLCRRAGGEEIRQGEGIREGRKEAWTFLVDPACLSIRPRRKLSAEALAKAQEHGRKLGKGKARTLVGAAEAAGTA
jgi:hypothetical protein